MAPDARAIGAILLAAGESKRLGQPKQFVEIDGEPLVLRQAQLLLELQPACVVVVTGGEHDRIESLVSGMPLKLVHNPEWLRGMGVSLACAVKAMPERVRAALVLLCDQWKVSGDDLARLVEAWEQQSGAAVVSGFEGTTGPPAILPRAMFERLSRLQGDSGAKRIIRNWKGDVVSVPMPAAAPDVDTPSDVVG